MTTAQLAPTRRSDSGGPRRIPRVASVNLSNLSDAQLLQRHCDGCPSAYGVLIDRHAKLLSWTLHNLRIATAERADILQESLLKVHRQAASFRGSGSAGPWLRAIITNTALTHLRDRGRRPEDVDASEEGLLGRLRTIPDARAVDDGMTVRRIILEDAVRTLHPGLREAFLLADLHGMSMQDVADCTGVPVGTVKSRVSRARRQLRVQLTDAGLTPTVRHIDA